MLLKQMICFKTVVELKSFTNAADKLNISQSTISQHISNLEKELDVALLIRHNRTFSLTPAGEYFFANCRAIIDDIGKLKKKTIDIGLEEQKESRLKVGYLSSYIGNELNQAIEQFSQDYPDIPIDFSPGTHEELYLGLINQTFDIVLNDQRRAFSDEFENLEVIKCDCYIEVSTNHYLAQFDEIEIDSLKRTPCILISSDEQKDHEAEYYKDTLGYDCPFLFANTIEQARLMVIAKRGFLPIQSATNFFNEKQNIKRIKILKQGKYVQRNYCVFYLKKYENYYIKEFGKLLKKAFNNSILGFID